MCEIEIGTYKGYPMLKEIWVPKNQRGKGIGSRKLSELEKTFISDYLYIYMPLPEVVDWYKKRGYKFVKKGLMVKKLR